MDVLAVSTESTATLLEDFDPEPAPEAREWFATQSQQAGLVRLDALADLFARIGNSKPGSFQPLLRALLIGGTGVGKSTLAREFARRRDWAYTSVDCGSWLIQGAYSKPPTLRILRDHVRSSSRTCIYLDEACKMFPSGHDTSSGWYLSVFSEFILLLDGDERLKGHEWTAEDIRKYKETCYVICGGAFTEALKEARVAQKRGGLGFVQAGPTATHSSKIQEALPEEIYHRFPRRSCAL
jgi:SpoVK/Ycf46/Vps4 family AAA+-type ATPase